MAEHPPRATERRDPHAGDDGDEPEPTTGVHNATRDFVREVNKSGIWKVSVGVGGFALACFLAGITVTKAMAQQAKDAGVEAAATAEKKTDAQGDELRRMRADFTEHVEVESGARVRMEKKLNALLDRFDVKDPAPTPKDGGR